MAPMLDPFDPKDGKAQNSRISNGVICLLTVVRDSA